MLPQQPGFLRWSGLKSEECFSASDGMLLHPASPVRDFPDLAFRRFELLRIVSMLLRFGICKAKGVLLQKQKAAWRGFVGSVSDVEKILF